jgi:hypothetical protein
MWPRQESQEHAHDQVPEAKAHVPVADPGGDADNEDERNRDGHGASLPSGSAAGGVLAGLPLLAAVPPGAGNALAAAVFTAMADYVGDGDDFADAAHLPGHLVSSLADSAGAAG